MAKSQTSKFLRLPRLLAALTDFMKIATPKQVNHAYCTTRQACPQHLAINASMSVYGVRAPTLAPAICLMIRFAMQRTCACMACLTGLGPWIYRLKRFLLRCPSRPWGTEAQQLHLSPFVQGGRRTDSVYLNVGSILAVRACK